MDHEKDQHVVRGRADFYEQGGSYCDGRYRGRRGAGER